MSSEDRLFRELRELRKQMEGVVKFAELSRLPQAMPYKRAAFELGIGLTELKEMVRLGMIGTVTYADGKRPKIPVEEIRRLTTLRPEPTAKPRGKPSKKRLRADDDLSPAEADAAVAALLKKR